jgi:hypothetical protein
MSSVKTRLKDKIDDTAGSAKKMVDKAVDKSRDVAHKAGEQLERGGKRLQKA